jgi:hypothetical protein
MSSRCMCLQILIRPYNIYTPYIVAYCWLHLFGFGLVFGFLSSFAGLCVIVFIYMYYMAILYMLFNNPYIVCVLSRPSPPLLGGRSVVLVSMPRRVYKQYIVARIWFVFPPSARWSLGCAGVACVDCINKYFYMRNCWFGCVYVNESFYKCEVLLGTNPVCH